VSANLKVVGAAAVLLAAALVPSQIANAGKPDPALTLVDAGTWTPTATLDTTQVEAPVTPEVDPADVEFGLTLGEGWEPFDGDIYDAEEAPHSDCWINVGDTSVIACADGFTTLS